MRKARPHLLTLAVVSLLGCGRAPLTWTVDETVDGSPRDAAAPSEAGASRVPKNHRAAGTSCPAQRAAGALPECPPGGDPIGDAGCLHDSECTDGTNGRCVLRPAPFFTCHGRCSYDGCFDDSACPALTPCECRISETVSAANRCVTGSNCRVDTDCGPGGFCSPSVVNQSCDCPATALCDDKGHCFAGQTEVPCACGDACGHGFYCHTKLDDCLDDADCGTRGTCNYDRLESRWTCGTCWPLV